MATPTRPVPVLSLEDDGLDEPVPIHLKPIQTLLAIAASASERELLSCAVQEIAALLGDRAYCVLIEGTPRVVASTANPSLLDWPLDLNRYPEISAALNERRVVAIEETREHALLRPVRGLVPAGVRSIVVLPLIAGGVSGALIAQSTQPRAFSREAITTATLVTDLTARLAALLRLRDGREAQAGVPVAIARAPSDPHPIDAVKPARRILIVDDNPDLCEDVASILRDDEDYDVLIACDGGTAVGLAREHRPDLILLDVVMPLVDGYEVARQLGEDPSTRDIPILFLSGADDLTTRIRQIRLRSADFLSKPFSKQELVARVERSMQHLAVRERLQQAAYTDELTSVGNLRLFHERLAAEESRSARHGTSVALVVIDIDRLKKINDELGHAAGSTAIKAVGSVLRGSARAMDVVTRCGGDEFVVLLPHATVEVGAGFARRAIQRLRDLRPAGIAVTVSIGIAATIATSEGSLTHLLERADAAAYRAKRQGGDRACVDDE
jgi:diguanylate cyclase (GGDEF)-like protein